MCSFLQFVINAIYIILICLLYTSSHDFFYEHTEAFYDFYFHEMVYPNAQPNPAHLALAKLEALGKLDAVITQNIDGLHQKAGSKKVLELHGSIHRNRCQSCHSFFTLEDMLKQKDGIPKCPNCHHTIKPEVVLYGESLDMQVMEEAVTAIANADAVSYTHLAYNIKMLSNRI